MKTTYKLLILSAILACLLLFAHVTRVQDSIVNKIPIGYEIDYSYLYVLVDTIHGMSQVHSVYPHKMYFSINKGKAALLKRGEVMTVWSTSFTVTVTRKRYKRIYNFK